MRNLKLCIATILLTLLFAACSSSSDDKSVSIESSQTEEETNTSDQVQSDIIFDQNNNITTDQKTISISFEIENFDSLPDDCQIELLHNGQPVTLTAESENSFSADIELVRFNNSLQVIISDQYDNSLLSKTLAIKYSAATKPNDAIELQITEINLDNFPQVSITVSANGTESNSPISDLEANNFIIMNAGEAFTPSVINQLDGQYVLTHHDNSCGKRELFIKAITEENTGISDIHTYGENYALIIGIDDYTSKYDSYDPEPNWNIFENSPDLRSCVNDAKGFNKTLLQSPMWSKEQITILTDKAASDSNIKDEIAQITQQMQAWDKFIFFFSGHGSESGGQYIITAGYPKDTNEKISVDTLGSAIQAVPKPDNNLKNIFIILDSCFSGHFTDLAQSKSITAPYIVKSYPLSESDPDRNQSTKSFSKSLVSMSSVAVLTASASNTTSLAGGTGEYSVFTKFLIEGLSYNDSIVDAPANYNEDSRISLSEAHSYTYKAANDYCIKKYGQIEQEAQLMPATPGSAVYLIAD